MTEQEREKHGPQRQTTTTQGETRPTATSGLSVTEQPTPESTATARQVTSELKSEQKLTAKKTSESSFSDNTRKAITSASGISSSTTTRQPTSRGLSTPPGNQVLSNELLAGGIAGGSTAFILIGLLLLAVYKRRKTRGLVLAHSNTQTAFDNLGFTGGRKISEYMDLSELELVRVRVANSVKRKISAITKEDLKTRRVSCGRLDLVEVPANSNIDSDVLLTSWV